MVSDQSTTQIPRKENPWRDEDLLRELYVEERMSQNDIRKLFDCSISTVGKWLERHGIEKRTRAEACKVRFGDLNEVSLYTDTNGYETWNHRKQFVRVHRLIAVAEYGIGAVKDSDIHHRNTIPFDNRPENLEVMDHSQHSSHHKKVDGLDRIRVAELYENGGLSLQKLADHLEYDITESTVYQIHKEFYPTEEAT